MGEDCVFCKIVRKEIPAKIVYETDDVLCFNTIEPVTPVHVLVIPKKHITSLSEVEESDWELLGNCQLAAKKVAEIKEIQKAFRVMTSSGKDAGQTVFHLHYHVIGGWIGSPPEMEIHKNFP